MKLSERGLRMICGYEGFVGHIYMDQAGVPTIGYGHALTRQEVVEGQYHRKSLTPDEALELCRKDVAKAEAAIAANVRVALTQSQYDALTSFTFNLGGGALATSTLLKKLNAGDYVGAAAEFVRFDHVNHREDLGLKGRREGEARLFLEGMLSVGGPTLDDVVKLASARQFDVSTLVDVTSPLPPDDVPTHPDPVREADTNPDVATVRKRET